MKKTRTTESTSSKTEVPPGVEPGLAAAMLPWAVGSRMASAWMEGITRMNGEWAHFIADRLAKDAETQHAIFECTSPVEAQKLGAEFLHRAMNDYLAEAARISTLGVRVAQDAASKE